MDLLSFHLTTEHIRFQPRWFFLQFGNITLLASLHLHTIIEKPRYAEGLQRGVW